MILFEDKKIKRIAKSENVKMPDKYINTIDETLNSLEDNNEKKKIKPMWKYGLNFAIAMAILSFIVLPNLSPEIAYAMQEIPIVGNIVKVITIKNYFDKDGNRELDVEIPNIKNDDNSVSESNEYVNKDVNELTQRSIDEFYAEEDPENHLFVKIESDVIENSKNWFTLRLTINETAGSSDLKYKYYHIDKKTDNIVNLGDLFINENYKNEISEEIKKQMISRMKADEEVIYWIDEEFEEWSFRAIDNNQNFYFSKDGNIIIVFDKYEVGPGSTGTPEFEIDKQVYEKYLKEEYK